MSFVALALSLVLATSADGPPDGLVRGQVRSGTTGNPLPYATVEVVDAQPGLRAVTDSTGMYVLPHVPAGRHLIRATHLDHAPFEVEILVPSGAQLVVDMALVLRPVEIPALLARARVRPGEDTVPAGVGDLGAASVKALEATPGVAELGLAEAMRTAPGNDPADPSDVLYIRGGAADLKLVLLDGAPVYAPFNVGGLVNAFEPEVLRGATLYLGGAPARYDGGLSYVLDLETRAGRRDATHATGAVDLLSGRALVDGPLGERGGYMIAGRGVHGLGAAPLISGAFPYLYADALARMDVDLGGDASLRATGFWNREAVRLDDDGPSTGAGSAYWGNGAGSVRARVPMLGGEAEFTAAYGDFEARLPIGRERPLIADGVSQRVRLAADLSREAGPTDFYYGLSYDRLWIRYTGGSAAGSGADSVFLDAAAGGDAVGAYVDGAWQPGARVRVRGGLRADLFSGEHLPRLGPRISVMWLLSDHASLTIAAGQYHQYVRASETALVSPPSGAALSPVPPLAVARASHLLLGFDQELIDGVRLDLEGFYKNFEGVPGLNGSRNAQAHSSGVDLWVRRNSGRYTGWLGYSLAWIWSLDGGRPAAADLFAGRQLLSAGVGATITAHTRFDLRVGYGAGLPYTAVPRGDVPAASVGSVGTGLAAVDDATPPPSPTGPEDPYLRVDAEVARTFRGRVFGTRFDLTPYVRVLNALDRRDAIFYQFDRGQDDQPRALATLPVLPIVGFSWRF
ncbi:MAG: TonB-dependent receptor [Gemmatimonadetes bacterium]|nr:TonB-dependent receptor [Gemmatimonadota bacterium]